MSIQTVTPEAQTGSRGFYRRLAWMAPLFFLAKGLLWLAAPFFIALYSL